MVSLRDCSRVGVPRAVLRTSSRRHWCCASISSTNASFRPRLPLSEIRASCSRSRRL